MASRVNRCEMWYIVKRKSKKNKENTPNFPRHTKQPYVYLKIASIFYNNTTHSEELGDVTCKL